MHGSRNQSSKFIIRSIAFFGQLICHRSGRAGTFILLLLITASYIAPLVTSGSALEQNLYNTLEDPSPQHWLGTDQLGRDLLARLTLGMRTTLRITITSTGLAMIIGVVSGVIAGYMRGRLELLLLRFVDVILSIPGLILALVLVSIIGAGTDAVVLALIVRAFPSFVRVTHSATCRVMGQEFVQSGIVLGSSSIRLLTRYIIPNILPPVIVLWPILLGIGVLISASLSFFGLGVQRPTPELGLLVADGRRYLNLQPSLLWLPGLVLTVTNIGLSLLSNGLRELLDPIQSERTLEM